MTFQAESPGALKPRIAFTDSAGASYRLAVTDLAWRYYAEHLQRTQALEPDALAACFAAALAGKEIFCASAWRAVGASTPTAAICK